MEKFLQNVFTKASEESGEKSLKKWAMYISDYLLEELKFQLSAKTLERYYNGKTEPNMEKRNKLAVFLGYSNYMEYLSSNQEEQTSTVYSIERERGEVIKNNYKKGIIAVLCIVTPIMLGVRYIGFSSGKEKCMIWNKDHYESTNCEGKEGEVVKRPYLMEHFRQITVSDTTTFFKNGKVHVWYDKQDKKIDYFTSPGINPETGKTVKPITEYMIQKYVMK